MGCGAERNEDIPTTIERYYGTEEALIQELMKLQREEIAEFIELDVDRQCMLSYENVAEIDPTRKIFDHIVKKQPEYLSPIEFSLFREFVRRSGCEKREAPPSDQDVYNETIHKSTAKNSSSLVQKRTGGTHTAEPEQCGKSTQERGSTAPANVSMSSGDVKISYQAIEDLNFKQPVKNDSLDVIQLNALSKRNGGQSENLSSLGRTSLQRECTSERDDDTLSFAENGDGVDELLIEEQLQDAFDADVDGLFSYDDVATYLTKKGIAYERKQLALLFELADTTSTGSLRQEQLFMLQTVIRGYVV